MFTIGEFSKVTGLTVKTLRFYHEEGLLEPTCVDERSGYRYYDVSKIEAARVISFLRSLEFPVAEIRELLQGSEANLTAALEASAEANRGADQGSQKSCPVAGSVFVL